MSRWPSVGSEPVQHAPTQRGLPAALERGREETVLCACTLVPLEGYFIVVDTY